MLTGPDLQEEHILDDGTPIVLRHIRPSDADELRRAFEHLSALSRYRRFQSFVNVLSDRSLRYLTDVDGQDHVAIVALRRDATGHEVGLGVARFIRLPEDRTTAEAALTVVDEAQRKGLGRILGIALARAAIERGVRRFRGHILGDNVPVRNLLAEVDAVIRDTSDGTVFEIELAPKEAEEAGALDRLVRRVLRGFSAAAAETPAA